jgi:hexosaminidase
MPATIPQPLARLCFPLLALGLAWGLARGSPLQPLTFKHALLPCPAQMEWSRGTFELSAQTVVVFDENSADLRGVADEISARIFRLCGLGPLSVQNRADVKRSSSRIELSLDSSARELGGEGYTLSITPERVLIRAARPAGVFHSWQTLRQLLPAPSKGAGGCALPAVEIRDQPRFAWRGLLLDCSRHFMSTAFIKRTIDLLAFHKLNVLHWHLTDDQGWRIEIKQFPKLTETGAWRGAGVERHGGFYTQEDIREIVAYARARFVTVIPEIELPGHCQAALAAYPEFSCTGGPFQVDTTMNGSREIFCPGNENTFTFLEAVLGEVCELFPEVPIHIGGDEVNHERWRACAKCQARIKKLGLSGEQELERFFISRVAGILLKKNRRIIGWDEVLHGTLAPGAVVQVWHRPEMAARAAWLDHPVIVSPDTHYYLNQSILVTDLKKTYFHDPLPPELAGDEAAQNVLGGECCLWTETIPESGVNRMLLPRLSAFAESMWSRPGARSMDFLLRRITKLDPQLESIGAVRGPAWPGER